MFYVGYTYTLNGKEYPRIEDTRDLKRLISELEADEDATNIRVLTLEEVKALNRCK